MLPHRFLVQGEGTQVDVHIVILGPMKDRHAPTPYYLMSMFSIGHEIPISTTKRLSVAEELSDDEITTQAAIAAGEHRFLRDHATRSLN